MVTSYLQGRVIPPQQMVHMVDMAPGAHTNTLRRNVQRFGVRLCYCSVYDECWTTQMHLEGERHQASSDCSVDE